MYIHANFPYGKDEKLKATYYLHCYDILVRYIGTVGRLLYDAWQSPSITIQSIALYIILELDHLDTIYEVEIAFK